MVDNFSRKIRKVAHYIKVPQLQWRITEGEGTLRRSPEPHLKGDA